MRAQDRDAEEATVRVGVVLPVHNEEHHLSAALAGVERAMEATRCPSGRTVECRLVVVLDDCDDGSAGVLARWLDGRAGHGSVEVVAVGARNVGLARRTGCAALLARWATVPAESVWLATTDADSEVPTDWLTAQLRAREQGAHVWIGSVEVTSWVDRAHGTADAWGRWYASEHMPVHGANFGIDAATYVRAGGFADRVTGEDRELADRALAHGAVARVDSAVRVATSGRRHARAPRGFAHALTVVEQSLPAAAAAS